MRKLKAFDFIHYLNNGHILEFISIFDVDTLQASKKSALLKSGGRIEFHADSYRDFTGYLAENLPEAHLASELCNVETVTERKDSLVVTTITLTPKKLPVVS